MVTKSSTKKEKKKRNNKSKEKKRKAVNVTPIALRQKNNWSGANASLVLEGDEANTTAALNPNGFPGGIDLYPTNHVEESLAKADFHMHSTCSDGKYKPSVVIGKAVANGVHYMSLTDHDTMKGVDEAIKTAKVHNVFVFPGVEISAEAHGSESIHILGYFAPGTESVELEKKLESIRKTRYTRGQGMLEKLRNMGIKLSWERVLEIAGEAAPGRPHVAEALVEAGHVKDMKMAFARYLHNDGPAYVQGEHFPPEEAIAMIREAGGVSVLAHPWCCKNPIALVPKLAAVGLHGLEVYHDKNKIEMYSALAKESHLIKTGGSDFHGINPNDERAPGDIPFYKKAIQDFLSLAKDVWNASLSKRVQDIKKLLLQTQEMADTKPSKTLCIWSEQVETIIHLSKEHDLLLTCEADSKHYTHVTFRLCTGT